MSAIPIHTMSLIVLPKSIVDGLDKASRSFLWGSTTEQRKLHLIAWDRICAPKREGGLAIRSTQKMNKAMLAKVGWRLIHDTSSLWATVIRSKYRVGTIHDQTWMKNKGNGSAVWRSIGVGLREVIMAGISWVPGNGREIHFWKDKWLSNTPLIEQVTRDLPPGSADLRAHELWQDGVGWRLTEIEPYVSVDTRLDLAAVVLDTVTGARDRLSWGEVSNGEFTVTSAYNLLTRVDSPRQNMESFYKKVW